MVSVGATSATLTSADDGEKIILYRPDGSTAVYTKIREDSTSGQSNIFLVKDKAGQEAVMKMYLRDNPSSVEDLEVDKPAAREISTLLKARAQGRSDIPVLLDAGKVKPGFMNHLPAIVMEPIKGKTLDEIIADKGHNPTMEEVLRLATSVGSTLRWAHQEAGTTPIYHRDIQPANIMLTDDGRYVTLDWSAGRFGSGETTINTQIVTPYYTAPETEIGRSISAATDVYSLGRILQAYLLGKDEFENTFSGEPVQQNFENRNVPKHVINALLKATEEKPENRFQSVDDFVHALENKSDLVVEKVERSLEKRRIRENHVLIGVGIGVASSLLGLLGLGIAVSYVESDEISKNLAFYLGFFWPMLSSGLGALGGLYSAKRKIKRLESQASHRELEQSRIAGILPAPAPYPSPLSSLDTRVGTLAELVPQFEEGSWRTSAELMKERITNKELRSQWFYTANYGLYRVVDGKVRFAFGGREGNPIFKNVAEASRQLLSQEQNYVPQAEDIAAAVQQALVDVDMQDLQLQRYDDEFSYFWIDTKDYERTSDHVPAQRLVAEAVYGKGEDFNEAMHMLEEEGKIKKTRVYVLNPEYVLSKIGEGKAPAVARACRLYDSAINASFIAEVRSVNLRSRLRGVPQAERADAR